MFNKKLIAVVSLSLLTLQGCALHRDKNPHNDVLVFGTTTKFALDVAAPTQNSGIPEFTLGYKRLEAVWMPLKESSYDGTTATGDILSAERSSLVKSLNDCVTTLETAIADNSERANFCLSALLPAGKYVSLASGIDSTKGGTQREVDTYSVFASLGAKGGLSINNASGTIAQFFATGIAAQRLGANPAVASALNAKAPEAAAKEAEAKKAEAEAEQEKSKEVQALLASGATPEQADSIARNTDQQIQSLNNEVIESKGCVLAWNGTPPASVTSQNGVRITSYFNQQDRLVAELRRDDSARTEILAACRT